MPTLFVDFIHEAIEFGHPGKSTDWSNISRRTGELVTWGHPAGGPGSRHHRKVFE
jgi:hypothetical protein